MSDNRMGPLVETGIAGLVPHVYVVQAGVDTFWIYEQRGHVELLPFRGIRSMTAHAITSSARATQPGLFFA